ncbi:hypothetical protein OR573_04920 [Halomonas sp. CH40]
MMIHYRVSVINKQAGQSISDSINFLALLAVLNNASFVTLIPVLSKKKAGMHKCTRLL